MKRLAQSILISIGLVAGPAMAADQYEYVSIALYDKMLQEAAGAYGDGEFDLAFENYSKLARWGDKQAQQMLGIMYLQGEGTDVDLVEGYVWIKLAAESKSRGALDIMKQVESQLPPAAIRAGDQLYDSYLSKYGAEAMGIKCSKKRRRSMGRPEIVCERDRQIQATQYRIPIVEEG